MAVSSQNGFYQYLQKESPKGGTFWFFGDEAFLIQDALERICSQLLGLSRPTLSENLNFEIYYGSEHECERVGDAITSLPFFSDFKLIVVKECEQFRDKEFEKLSEVIAQKDPAVTLVLLSSEVDKRTKAYKKIEKLCMAVEFQAPYEREMPQWIQYLAQQQKLQIGPAESQLLISLIGTELFLINNELKKMALGLEERKRIEMADIEKYSSMGKEENIFALSDLLATRSITQALALLKKLLEQGQSAIAMTSLIARHFRILLSMSEGRGRGLVSQDLTEKLAIPQFLFKKYWEQSLKWNLSTLADVQIRLAETDKSLKSTSISPSLVLESFILSLVPSLAQDKSLSFR